jgi:hypothetical protein
MIYRFLVTRVVLGTENVRHLDEILGIMIGVEWCINGVGGWCGWVE